MKIVEGFALNADQLVVLAFEPDFLGDVFIKIGDAAKRMLLADDMKRLAVGQVPPALARLERGVGVQLAGLPVAIIRLLGELRRELAQPVENFAIARAGVRANGVEPPQVDIGGVEKTQALIGAEDRDRGRRACRA